MKKSRFLILIAWLLIFKIHFGQTNPLNFTRIEYGAGSQNWTFEQDADGRIYVANNEGLLTFNGAKWEVFPMPNQTIVRFIAFGSDGRLYAGGQDEIGYFTPDIQGRLVFVSLLKLIDDDDRRFADIWNIVSFGDAVFFRSFSRVFRLHKNKITAYRTVSKWDFLGVHNNRLIAHDKSRGLLEYINGDWHSFISPDELPPDIGITSIVPFRNKSLVTTSGSGLFQLTGNRLAPFKLTGKGISNDQYFTAAQPTDFGNLLLGTYDHGLFHADSTGNVIEVFSKSDGLNSSNIKCIFKDNKNNIWLGLEDGLSVIDLNSPVTWLNSKLFNGAAGYSAAVFENHLFFAMANGIYKMPLPLPGNFKSGANEMIKIASGLSWKIANVQGRLFAGRDDGFFEVKENKLVPIDQSTGYWIFKPFENNNALLQFAAGNYAGVSFFKTEKDKFLKQADLSYLNTSARFLEYDSLQQAIWISHPYRGVYRISMPGNTVKLFTEKDGLPSALNNHVFKINSQIVVATVKGIYMYNSTAGRFELSSGYDKIFKGLSIRYLRNDEAGNIWFVSEKKIGLVDGAAQSIIYFPELQRKILSGFENIFPIDKNNVLIGGEEGFFQINYQKYLQKKHKPSVFIRYVTAKNGKDSLLWGGFGKADSLNKSRQVQLKHQWNSLHFEFSSPFHVNTGNLEYSYRLKGFEEEWSVWVKKTEKDYTNLNPGPYVFEIKVRNNLNEESGIASYELKILPPWYKTIWAIIFYMLLFVLLFYLVYKQQEKAIHKRQEQKMLEERRVHEEKQQMLSYQHQLELEKSEKELMQLSNEKLESELASTAMNLVQKKEFILRIKDEISKLNKQGSEQIDSTELKKILRSLTAEDKLDEEWDQFSIHFNKVHGNFLTNLKNKFPDLKAHELKLCAYLRMNLSSKEIAQLLSISVRGVEISRYRLRKKLQLQPKEDLFQFLFNLDNPGGNSESSKQNV
jgi:DNA-binding CsgD family transcriptional regulator